MKRPYSNLFVTLFLILTIGICVKESSSYKILMVFPSFSPSHLIFASGLLKGLTKFGHEVTMVSGFPQERPIKNYRDVVLSFDDLDKDSIMADMANKPGNVLSHMKRMPEMMNLFYEAANKTMKNPEFRKIMEEETFDLLIVGAFANQFLSGLAYHLKCPWIILNQVPPMHSILETVGNPLNIASTPHVSLGYRGPMTFMQRLINFFASSLDVLLTQYVRSLDGIYYESNFPHDKFPAFEVSIRSVSLVLLNYHFTQGIIRPNVPAVVEIGGVHVEDKIQPLPRDIQKFLDTASDGAIFLSFGSNVKTSVLPKEKLDVILKCFGKLKEKVLFKWETDTLPNKPDNMMIGKWMPQRDILAHKNIKLFVSHGGMGSIAEAKYRGVPLIGVPFFGDQMGNIASISQEGWAYQLNFDDLTEETFSAALTEVLTNSKYLDTARKMAELYKDRPQTALETANFWIEYVIRHKGAPHMQSNAVHLNFWQNNSIDVIAFLFVVIFLITKILLVLILNCISVV